ncbi:MAG: serine/threonine-protein kinase [Planctomycetota bacterium]
MKPQRMMDACPTQDDLEMLIHESLTPDRTDAIVSHIETCEICKATLADSCVDLPLSGCDHPSPAFLRRLRMQSPHRLIPDDDWQAVLQPAEHADEIGRLDGMIIHEVLGTGGMGVVLGAVDPRLERTVAIKLMRPGLASRPRYRERFLREARAMASIDHPNVVPVYQVDENAGTPYLVMKRLQGETLATRMRCGKQATEAFLRQLVDQAASGLDAAHKCGTFHRDIKPENIWLEAPDARVRLLDFGLALPHDATRLTSDGAILGTPAYMSPEQARGIEVDARTDYFSLGAVLYEAASGQLPCPGENVVETLAALTQDTPTDLHLLRPDLSAELSGAIMGLLAKDPKRRIGDLGALRRRLESRDDAGKRMVVFRSAKATVSRNFRGAKGDPSSSSRWPRTAKLASAFLVATVLLGVTILQIRTPSGTIVVELADGVDPDAVTIEASNAGKVTIMDGDHGWTIDVKEGQYSVAMLSGTDQFVLDKDIITVTRDGKAHLYVARRPLPEHSDANSAQSTESAPFADRVNRFPPLNMDAQESFIRWVFSVGGSVQIRVNPGDPITIQEASEIPGTRPLEMHTVNLTDASIRDQDIDRLAEAGRVYRLYLGAKYGPTSLTGDSLRRLRLLENLDVRDLHLDGITLDRDGWGHLSQLRRLTNLSLARTPLSEDDVARFSQLTRLKGLTLWDCGVTGEGLSHLGALPLELLNLFGSQIRGDAIANLPTWPNLENLVINAPRPSTIDDQSVMSLSKSSNLRYLRLAQLHNVTSRGLDVLASLPELESLLIASIHGMSDANMKSIATELPKLRTLTLKTTTGQITETGFRHLETASHLKVIDFGSYEKNTPPENVIARLRRALPDCVIRN